MRMLWPLLADQATRPPHNGLFGASETCLEDIQAGFCRRAIDVQRGKHEQHALLGVEQQPARATLLRHLLRVRLVVNVHGDREATAATSVSSGNAIARRRSTK